MSRSALLVLLFAAPALAQPAPKHALAPDDFEKDLDALFVKGGLTAEQAAGLGTKTSPAVHRKVAEIEASLAQLEQARLAQIPILSAKASYTRLSFIPPLDLGGGFVIPFLQNSYDMQASAVLPLSDYIVTFPKFIAAARAGAEAARVGRHSSELGAAEEARLAYYEWVRSKLQVVVARRQLTQVNATLGQIRALAEVQRLSRADLLRVESQEAQAEQAVDQLAQLEQLREEQLRLIIGAGATDPLAIGEDIRAELAAPKPTELDQLVKHANERRLDLRAIDLGIHAKEEARIAERSKGWPQLSGFATVEDARPNQRVFPQKDEFKTTWLAGIQLSWQLPDTLNAEANARRISAEASELRADREALLRGTRLELLAAQNAVQLAVAALQTSQKGLVAAEEGYRVRKELLAAERATAVELVDAETDLTRARIVALDARVDLRVALAQLAHALGDDTGK